MIKQLYIAEKPSLGRAIAEEIGIIGKGNGYIKCKNNICVTWCVGHLYTLKNPDDYDASLKKWNIDILPFIPAPFVRKFSTPRIKPQVKVIKDLLVKTEVVVHAGDADREGQIIVDEVLEELRWKGPVERLWIKALNSKALQAALNGTKSNTEYKGLSEAAVGRSRADWVAGMNATRAFTVLAQQRGHQGVFSVGRVQTPTLEMVVRRDLDIENFKKTDYYLVDADFKVAAGNYLGTWQVPEDKADHRGLCLSKDTALQLIESLVDQLVNILSVDAKNKKTLVELPFSLSSLQVYCNKKFGLGAKQVLDIAQSLYETHKATTYPRTDCNYLEENDFADVKSVLLAVTKMDDVTIRPFMAHCDVHTMPRCFNSKKITAHTGIVPTTEPANIGKMSADELKVYDVIRRRYIAQFMPPYEYQSTIVVTECGGEIFKSNGNVMLEKGWKIITNDADKKDKVLPEIIKGEPATCQGGTLKPKQIQPPKRYTEGLLIADMENVAKYVENSEAKKMLKCESVKGIGTEATRANIIEGLKAKGYINEQGKTLISTEKARKFLAVVPAAMKDPITTAEWEFKLSDIAKGNLSLNDFERQVYSWVSQIIADIKANPEKFIPQIERDFIKCPACQRELKRWKSKQKTNAFFWGCVGFMDEQNQCKTIFPDEAGKPDLDYKSGGGSSNGKKYFCTKCGEELIHRANAKSPFWGCKGYYNKEQQCKETYPDKKGEPDFTPQTVYKCKKCESKLIRRKSKKSEGFWWGCSGYSNGCKETYFDDKGKPKY